jgi:hypothetical protein
VRIRRPPLVSSRFSVWAPQPELRRDAAGTDDQVSVPPSLWSLCLYTLAFAAAGCTGALDDNAAGAFGSPTGRLGGDAGTGRGDGALPGALCGEATTHALEVPMRRLTPVEYRAALVSMFGDGVPDVSDLYPAPAAGYGYTTYADAHRVGELQAEALLDAAERIAEHVAPTLPDCATTPLGGCARTVLEPLITRAFRRPAEPADVDRLVAIADGAVADGLPPNEAIAVAIIALLQEPRFLYVVESRAEIPEWTLDAHERAQRLALTFWGDLPDALLLERAASGTLDTPAGMIAETARVTGDPRARETFQRFVREWLGLSTLPTSHEPALAAALDAELTRLIDDAWSAPDGLDLLLRADTGYADSVLETFYELPAVSSGPGDFRRVSMPGLRVGLVTHPLVLAATSHGDRSSPILRGKLIRTRFLCTALGSPPAGAIAAEPSLPDTATARERYEARIANGTCASCHVYLDPIGFGLERFDGLGRLRTEIDGLPVDEVGELLEAGDATGTFVGPEELGDVLAGSEDVTRCFTRQLMRYAIGRDDGRDTMCMESDLAGAFLASDRSMPALFRALGESPAFVERTGDAP